MAEEESDLTETLPCGCIMGRAGGIFVFEPHALDCEWFAYVLALAEERGIPTWEMDA